ncbi:CoA transferase [Flammeovirga yaeyamensis]|uniref:CoA transferase n=1 Tax=Flammeovirga yaeyamensis TaxID=367791 RepID=A0AAX1N5S6_9BACT|nr:CoA transferase [Flammeovirga yaeyamensis]MBB3697380.1 crotonobetainyl-CoA:carnitine CoA-transferase CaiB-like acyl-CoA transferase [Flammeovirga yaeyamensis]NMF36074.1 CoA transferase [Flammeovirga yaeyamensis]QWG02809.1 CoA transferase [Flammeovirga yaeyamensis]
MLPLEGILVLEFCQFMAGPSAGLKLADLGARVIKIERPKHGEGGRQIAIKNLFVDNSSLVFHTVNRNKESYAANLKDADDLEKVKKLIQQADVMTHNFRPGVMEKIGLDYKTVKELNPKMIYASVTGYGTIGPWVKKPGQDLLAQSISGLTHLTGDKDDAPTPMGLAVADIFCGTHLTQGILAALVSRGKSGKGALVEVSLLESMLDFQFEVITTYLNGGKDKPVRANKGNAHAYLSAPYGVYKTYDGYIALAMGSLLDLGKALGCKPLLRFENQEDWFTERNLIMNIIRDFLLGEASEYWIEKLEKEGIWCAEVFNYEQLINHEGYQLLNFDQVLTLTNGEKVHTTRCPIQVDDQKLFSRKGAPRVGEHTDQISKEFNL